MVFVSGIDFESIADGEGVRVTIFFSGCKHNCKGCHNPSSHPFDAGKPFTDDLQDSIISYVKATPFISGVTLSGGDPVYSASEIAPFIRRLRNACPNVTVWLYTGFTFPELLTSPEALSLLKLCDVVVDGPFVIEQRDPTIPYRGSRNQRIVDVKSSLASGQIVDYIF